MVYVNDRQSAGEFIDKMFNTSDSEKRGGLGEPALPNPSAQIGIDTNSLDRKVLAHMFQAASDAHIGFLPEPMTREVVMTEPPHAIQAVHVSQSQTVEKEVPHVQVMEKIREVPQFVTEEPLVEVAEVEKAVHWPEPEVTEKLVEVPFTCTSEQVAELLKEVAKPECQVIGKEVTTPVLKLVQRNTEVGPPTVQKCIVEVPRDEVQEMIKQVPVTEAKSEDPLVQRSFIEDAGREAAFNGLESLQHDLFDESEKIPSTSRPNSAVTEGSRIDSHQLHLDLHVPSARSSGAAPETDADCAEGEVTPKSADTMLGKGRQGQAAAPNMRSEANSKACNTPATELLQADCNLETVEDFTKAPMNCPSDHSSYAPMQPNAESSGDCLEAAQVAALKATVDGNSMESVYESHVEVPQITFEDRAIEVPQFETRKCVKQVSHPEIQSIDKKDAEKVNKNRSVHASSSPQCFYVGEEFVHAGVQTGPTARAGATRAIMDKVVAAIHRNAPPTDHKSSRSRHGRRRVKMK